MHLCLARRLLCLVFQRLGWYKVFSILISDRHYDTVPSACSLHRALPLGPLPDPGDRKAKADSSTHVFLIRASSPLPTAFKALDGLAGKGMTRSLEGVRSRWEGSAGLRSLGWAYREAAQAGKSVQWSSEGSFFRPSFHPLSHPYPSRNLASVPYPLFHSPRPTFTPSLLLSCTWVSGCKEQLGDARWQARA
jgi:hypothetical protein